MNIDVYYTKTFFLHLFTQKDSWTWNESVLPVQPAVFFLLVLSCLDIICGLEKSCTVSGLPVTVWHEYECGRGAGGQRSSPADGMGITRTASQHVRCSMTGVEAANISSQNTSTWDYQVKLNRSGSRVSTSMCLMFECTSLCGALGCSGHTESFVEHLQECCS